MRSIFIVLGALLAALSVGLGAFGAHGLRSLVEQNRFSAKDLETFHTAVQYQMTHALGLILIGLLSNVRPNGLLTASGWTMFFGTVVFSGFLYAYVSKLGALEDIQHETPFELEGTAYGRVVRFLKRPNAPAGLVPVERKTERPRE